MWRLWTLSLLCVAVWSTVCHGSLRPVILVPGVAGSVLRSRNGDSGATEDVWLRATYADTVFREHLLGWYQVETDEVQSFFPGWSIEPDRGDFGLDGVDSLYRTRLIRIAAVDYFHDMILFLKDTLGYEPGRTLFALPYDWRLPSNCSRLVLFFTTRLLFHAFQCCLCFKR